MWRNCCGSSSLADKARSRNLQRPAASYCTICVTEDSVLAIFESPAYVALIQFLPAGSEEIVSRATPPFSGTTPNIVVPRENVTGPLGITVGEVTVKVSVTG